MKAYVVNLARSVERRASMVEQLERIGVDHEFIEAVDGPALTAEERAELVDEELAARLPWYLTPGLIGCALSHLRIYQRVLQSGAASALVLEDDAVLPLELDALSEEVARHLRGKEVALLYFRGFGVSRFSEQEAIALSGGARLLYPIRPHGLVTTAAYVITREACEAMAATVLPVRAGADDWAHFYELGAIESLRCVVPRLVSVRKDFKSTMDRVGLSPLRLRATSFIARRRIFPLYQLLALNRRVVESRMSRLAIVPERSQIAARREG